MTAAMNIKLFIKKTVPKSTITQGKEWLSRIDRAIIPFFAKHGILSSLYYFLLSRDFDREHRAVLLGRVRYWQSLTAPGKSNALLRRNTHRLEKGMIMRPRKAIFAESYIMETVDCFVQACQSKNVAAAELRWAHDVLSHYFSITGSSPEIVAARAKFMAADYPAVSSSHKVEVKNAARSAATTSCTPYARDTLPDPKISPEQLKQLFIRRRSVRWYQQKPVPDALIREAINMATFAPSACNRQPYEFVVINDAARATTIAKCASGTVGFAENLPCLLVVVGHLNAYPEERDRHCIYIDGSLAAMQLMLALETLGLSSCPINWPDIEFRERLISKHLKLGYDQRPIMLMAVGYADGSGGIPYSQKKCDEVLIRADGQ